MEGQMSIRVFFTLVLVLSMTGTAHAKWDVWDGNKLQEMCQDFSPHGHSDVDDVFKTGGCVGYVMGVASALEGQSFCLSKTSVQTSQLIDVMKLWLDQHPELRQYSASTLIVKAFSEKFPCN
jgi:Rap1a immunity proteins